jgi:hypothetical protein
MVNNHPLRENSPNLVTLHDRTPRTIFVTFLASNPQNHFRYLVGIPQDQYETLEKAK